MAGTQAISQRDFVLHSFVCATFPAFNNFRPSLLKAGSACRYYNRAHSASTESQCAFPATAGERSLFTKLDQSVKKMPGGRRPPGIAINRLRAYLRSEPC